MESLIEFSNPSIRMDSRKKAKKYWLDIKFVGNNNNVRVLINSHKAQSVFFGKHWNQLNLVNTQEYFL